MPISTYQRRAEEEPHTEVAYCWLMGLWSPSADRVNNQQPSKTLLGNKVFHCNTMLPPSWASICGYFFITWTETRKQLIIWKSNQSNRILYLLQEGLQFVKQTKPSSSILQTLWKAFEDPLTLYVQAGSMCGTLRWSPEFFPELYHWLSAKVSSTQSTLDLHSLTHHYLNPVWMRCYLG